MIVRLQDVSKAYAEHVILNEASFELSEKDRVGLVGINGAGKTTILRLMLGTVEPDSGAVERARGARVGYLPQEVDIDSDRSVMEEALSALPEVQKLEARLAALEEQLGTTEGEALEKAMEDYGHTREAFEREGGYQYRARAESVLQGLGLPRDHWERPAKNLSGGQKSRLMLARLLLSEPDGLLLDEPTNHLDIQAIEWLEGFLLTYPKAFLIVSHDRYFLDRTVTRMALLERTRLRTFVGNYTKFRKLHEAETERYQKEYDRQQELIQRTQDFIRKNLVGQKTKQAQSRRNMLERMERIEKPLETRTHAAFKFRYEERSGERALWAEELTAGYPDHPILEAVTLTLKRRDRVGLVGPNGTGKTTLLKTLAKRLPTLSGTVGHGARVTLGYFDQEQADLDDEKTVIDTMWELMSMAPEVEVRSFLGMFDFSEERVFAKVGDLSGGERGRLQMARIVKQSPNLLLLDEPTNHLDLHTREALEDALAEFTGTLVVVSHDRYFLDRVCNLVIAVEPDPSGNQLVHYPGNFTDYHNQLAGKAPSRLAPAAEPEADDEETPVETADAPGKRKKKRKKPRPAASNAEKKRPLSEIEDEIFQLEATLREISDRLATGADGDKTADLKERYEDVQSQLEDLYAEWDEVTT